MAVTDVDIANIALRMVKGEPITAIDDNTADGRKISDLFDHVRDDLLRQHNWNFAIKRHGLIGFMVPKPEFGFDREYVMPTGNGGFNESMRVVDIDRGGSEYRVEEDRILCSLNGEPTNLLSDQADFTTANWTETNTGTVTANDTTGPNGSDDADKIVDGDGTNRYVVSQAVTVADNEAIHFLGAKVKADDASYISLQCKLTGGTTTITAFIEFDATNLVVTKGGAQGGQIHSYDVVPLDNGFYWIWLGVKNNQTGNTTLTYELYPSGLTNDAATVTTGIWAVDAWLEEITPIDGRWVEKVTDPDDMTPDFRLTLATALSVDLAIAVAGSGTLHDRQANKLRLRLRKARSTDAIEDFPEKFPLGSWATSRRGSL